MSRKIIFATIILIVLIVLIPSFMIIVSNHNDKLMLASEKKIIEAAIKCYREKICLEDKVTLEMLYEEKYLEKEANPVTKEYYNVSSYVLIEEEKFVIK